MRDKTNYLHLEGNRPKRYRLGGCSRCGGDQYLDEAEREWCCFQCGRREACIISFKSQIFHKASKQTEDVNLPRKETLSRPALKSACQNLKRQAPLDARLATRNRDTDGHWWPPGEIRFSFEQVVWLLSWLSELRGGFYPPDHRETGYYDTPIVRKDKRKKRRAYFTTPVEFAAEIDQRLAMTGFDRYLVEDRYLNGIYEDEIARKLNMSAEEIWYRIRSAVWSVCGQKRKKTPYSLFKKQWKYRRKQLSRNPSQNVTAEAKSVTPSNS